MRVDVITLFPEIFAPFRGAGIVGRALESGKVDLFLHDLREHGEGNYRKVDDAPYGGGAGMVFLPGPLFAAVDAVQAQGEAPGRVVLLSPQGRQLDQAGCARLSEIDRLVLVCGRYEGVDERFIEARVDEEISIGDYVLCGGELPAMVLVEAITRLLPGALGDPASAENDSFSRGLLDHPHYTRPEVFAGMDVPKVLLSGNHAEIERWRQTMAVENTRRKRPDLLAGEQAPERGNG
jgi:tRNA (guanine37-N1)-methyltransferase